MVKRKIGRNEPCWCGSGIKFKKCHRDREEQSPVEPWEASRAMREKFSKQICSAPIELHPECAQKIIKAHTIPKSTSLKAISVDGHVLGLKFGLESFQKYGGKLQPEKVGINKASTFTGFCQKHDDQIFACIEKDTFKKTDEQCFKLAFRSFAREYYAKSALVDMFPVHSSLDKGKSINKQAEVQEMALFTNIGAEAGHNDNQFHKKQFDQYILSEDYSDIRAVIVEFTEPFPVQVSGSVNPDFCFQNKKIQDLSNFDLVPDLLSFTSFFDGEKSYIVLSWLKYCHSSCSELVRTLLEKPRKDIPVFLLQYIFSNFENYFISPIWWDSLATNDKDMIIDISHENVSIYVEPNGESICTKLIHTELPKLSSIEFVNWAI